MVLLKVILACILFIGLIGLGFWHTYKKWRIASKMRALNKGRTSEDLALFYDHFVSNGVPKEIVDCMLNALRSGGMASGKFVPKLSDSFTRDYNWTLYLSSQYSTYQMWLAAWTLRNYNMTSVKESDWNEFQEKNGVIDDYESLFKYVLIKTGHEPKNSV